VKNILITGGAGFIGCHLAKAALDQKIKVTVLDNLSRKGADENLNWLKASGPVEFIKADITNRKEILALFKTNRTYDAVFHLAGQVAVTTSVKDPLNDFDTNAQGTINLLEGVRSTGHDSIFLFASTNKVYGGLENISIVEKNDSYEFKPPVRGVSEDQPLDFHSPYGCSKGAAEQYVRDYARIYGLKTVVFRQSCIYGTRQFGIEDQGWVAWFMIAQELGLPVTIYGNGKQVRDLLHIDDLIRAFFCAVKEIKQVSGKIFNIGGGPDNTLSVLQLINRLAKTQKNEWKPKFAEERPGDQKLYISNIERASKLLGWKPKIRVDEGLTELRNWVRDNRSTLSKVHQR